MLVGFADKSVVNLLLLDGASSIPDQEAGIFLHHCMAPCLLYKGTHVLWQLLTQASASFMTWHSVNLKPHVVS